MNSSSAYKSVIREYGREKLASDYLLKSRRDEVYLKIPRIKDIDDELMILGINVSKQILGGRDNTELLTKMQKNNEMLVAEKYRLLGQHGYSKDYFTNIYKCPRCKDTGFIKNERCNCLVQRLINKYYEISNLSAILKEENFDTFDLRYYSEEVDPKTGTSPRANMRNIYMNCLNFVENFDTKFENILLYGSTALGKTFLCNCIAKDLLDRGKNVVYITSSQLFKMVEQLRFNRNEEDEPEDYMDMVFSSSLLIIDDLGAEFSTSVTAAELFNIINTRHLERKPTIISTNLNPRDFEKQYSDRITSRILGNYTIMRFIGEDIRLKKKYGM